MKFSIITPSFNRSEYIISCIHSVMSQSYKNFEHIIIDGGSKDGTTEILKQYENQYNLRWVSEPDNGMYDAINKGIKLASGDVISILNTDDMYLPYTLEIIYKHIIKGYDIVYGDLIVSKVNELFTRTYLQFYKKFNRRYYTHFATLAHPTIFINKKLVDIIGFYDTNFKLLGDCEYWMRCVSMNFIPHKIDEIIAIQIDHSKTLRESYPLILSDEFKLLRHKYKVPNDFLNKKIFGKIQNVIYARYYKMLFILVYLFGFSSKWKLFIDLLKDRQLKINLKNSILGLLPGFLTKNLNYSQFDLNKIVVYNKDKTIKNL